jgi:thymidylate synthase (FAD)
MALTPAQKAELEAQKQDEAQPTCRATVPAIDNLLYTPFEILDHGFIRVVDYMGDDAAIVQAARVSYGRGTKKVSQDQGLINYLMRHRHTTPFEMCEIKFHVKMPIFVAREWIRHRTANVNEYSGRYSILTREFYLPDPSVLARQSTINNQGRGELLTAKEAEAVRATLHEDADKCYDHYLEMMGQDEQGNVVDPNSPNVARELARMNLTLNYYTEMYWKIDLHNLLHFLSLRADNHAQYEIRVYAEKMLDIVKAWVPYTYEAFLKYRKNGAVISEQGLQVMKDMIAGKNVTPESSGMSPREWRELMEVLELPDEAETKAA